MVAVQVAHALGGGRRARLVDNIRGSEREEHLCRFRLGRGIGTPEARDVALEALRQAPERSPTLEEVQRQVDEEVLHARYARCFEGRLAALGTELAQYALGTSQSATQLYEKRILAIFG